jgi:hypothetical protein
VIHTPRRSVTRFFIPLIDVLILLFCIFLLMPFVSQPAGDKADPPPPAATDPTLPDTVEKLQAELAAARRRVEELRRRQANPADRLSVRVLEIDKDTGKLTYFDADAGAGRQEVRDQADAQRLINQQRARAGAKDVFFLILYPRELTGYPLREQVETYRRWFRDVPFGFDNPWTVTPP